MSPPPARREPSVAAPGGPDAAQDPLKGRLLAREWWMFGCGVAMLLLLVPLTATTVATTHQLWDALDRGFMGKPQDGVVSAL
eukprot:gene10462-9120_t